MTSAIVADSASATTGQIKLKWTQWRNAVTTRLETNYEARIIQKKIYSHPQVTEKLFYKSVIQQFRLATLQTTKFTKTGLPASFMTQAHMQNANYAEFLFGEFTPGIRMSANTKLELSVPAQLSFADDQLSVPPKTYTQYEIVGLTCYNSLCTSQTGITSPTSPLPFSNVFSTYTNPYYQDTDKLYFSVQATWRTPAFNTAFTFVLTGKLEIDT